MQNHLWPVSVRLLLANQQLDSPLDGPPVRMPGPPPPHENFYHYWKLQNWPIWADTFDGTVGSAGRTWRRTWRPWGPTTPSRCCVSAPCCSGRSGAARTTQSSPPSLRRTSGGPAGTDRLSEPPHTRHWQHTGVKLVRSGLEDYRMHYFLSQSR